MERGLPLICIESKAFYVDVAKEQFREYGNPAHCISFNHLQGDGDHYLLKWSRQTGTVFESCPDLPPGENLVVVKIPPIVRLDPVGLALKYNKPVSAFMGMKSDTEW